MDRELYEDQISEAFDSIDDNTKITILEDIYEPVSDLVLNKIGEMSDGHFESVLSHLGIEIKEEEDLD